MPLLARLRGTKDRWAFPTGKRTACYTRRIFGQPITRHGTDNEGRSGETGRRAGFKIPWGSLPVWVRVPPPAPRNSTVLDLLAFR